MIIFRIQWWPLRSSTDNDSIPITKPMIPLIFRNRLKPISDDFKQDVYNQCKSFSQRSHVLGSLQRNNHNGQFFFSNLTNTLQDVYLLVRYSPISNDKDGLYLQIATSYLLSQNLQQLSIQQQTRTRVAIFLSENYRNVIYTRLEQWFKSIYAPYTAATYVIRTIEGNQASWEFMMNYTKYNKEVRLDTILFLLEDNYIYEADMLSDTIEFFASYNPCFVHHTDYSDRCRLNINDGYGHLLVPGRTRLWRSISSITITYACRLKTFLAFEDIIMYSKNTFESSRKIRTRVGNTAIFCAIPSHSAQLETLYLPNEINIKADDDTAPYYKDWWSIARHALAEAQKKDLFPAAKINEQNLFT